VLFAARCSRTILWRDWFDFLWYVRRGVAPNLEHLSKALDQHGPWAGKGVAVDSERLARALAEKIDAIDWGAAAADVEPFVSAGEAQGLRLWGRELFHDRLNRLPSG
jgi:hypothetical protein